MTTKTSTKSTKRKSTSAGPRRSSASASKATASKVAPVSAPVPAAAPDVVEENVVTTAAESAVEAKKTADDDRLRRPDLIEAIAARVSLKRSEAKMVFDVVLDEIGKALDASDEVVVPPLGKLMVKKRDQKPAGMMLTMKLKRASEDPTAGDLAPLADPDDAS